MSIRMLFFKTDVFCSKIEGRGVFSKERISSGSIVGNLAHDCRYISESEYCQAQQEGDERVIQTGIRLAGRSFIFNENAEPDKMLFQDEDFINHSEDPSLLYHCGLLFALKDIDAGDELTVNYKYFLSEKDITAFSDSRTAKRVDGAPPHQALLESTLELARLLTAGQAHPKSRKIRRRSHIDGAGAIPDSRGSAIQ